MPEDVNRRSSTRETRLLLVTIAVSVAVLFVLARFRFPEQEQRVELPAPAPLERLAARATYDELASIIAQLGSRLSPSIAVLRASGVEAAGSLTSVVSALETSRWVPALRLTPDVAVVSLRPGERVDEVVGHDERPIVLASDPVHGLAIVRVPASIEADPRIWDSAVSVPTYVVAVEGTRGGPALRPLFLSRTDPVVDPRWKQPLLALGGGQEAPAGSLVFSLEGRLIGIVVVEEEVTAIVPAALVRVEAEALMKGQQPPVGDLGIEIHDLTPRLSDTIGAASGAVVSHVIPGGPAADVLQIGDVIEAMNGEPVTSAEVLRIAIARTPPGTEVSLDLVRRGERQHATIVAQAPPGEPPSDGEPELGLVLETVRGAGSEVVRVAPRSQAARAGLLPDDVIVRIDGEVTPTAAEIQRMYTQAEPGTRFLVVVSRRLSHLVLVLEKP